MKKKHLLFGLIIPVVSLISLLAISFPFINLSESLEFSLTSRLIIVGFLLLSIISLMIDGYFTKNYHIHFLISVLVLLFLNNNYAYALAYVLCFIYLFYLLIMYRTEPKTTLTYGLYNRLSYNIYLVLLLLTALSCSFILIGFKLYWYLFLSFGLAIILVLAYNLYYDHKLNYLKLKTINEFKLNQELVDIYNRYQANMNNETKTSFLLYISLGYLLEGNYLEGAKAFDSIIDVKLFDISLYYEEKLLYSLLVNKSFAKSYKILNLYEEYIKQIKSKAKRTYFYNHLAKLKELLDIFSNKKAKHEPFTKPVLLEPLYEYLINAKLNIKQDINLKYENSGIYLLLNSLAK